MAFLHHPVSLSSTIEQGPKPSGEILREERRYTQAAAEDIAAATTMLSDSHHAAQPSECDQALRVYRICYFKRGAVVPDVMLVDAVTDEQAMAIARTIRPGAEREVWDRHRLVEHFQSAAGPVPV
jgi:hypothetical protein